MNFFEFNQNPINGGVQYKHFFTNGYGVSIVQHSFSHGASQGLWEMAVLKGTKDDWDICYDTPITSDVLGYLTVSDVNDYCTQVEQLPEVTKD